MNASRMAVAVLFLWMASTQNLLGQDMRVRLGGLVVDLGMTATEVASQAELKSQSVTTVPGIPDSAFVLDSLTTSDDPRALGTIHFRDGTVYLIDRKWTVDKPVQGVDVGNAIFGLASQFVEAGRTNCQLGTRAIEEPGQQEQVVTVRCGRRTMTISTIRNDQHGLLQTDVTERVQ